MKNELPQGYKLTMWNFIIPILFLFGSLFATIFWSGDLVNNGLVECFRNANITLAICIAFMGGAVGAGIMGVSTKLFSVTKPLTPLSTAWPNSFLSPSSWCVLGLWFHRQRYGHQRVSDPHCRELPDSRTGPALVFLFGALISFSTGSSWGVWSIMMPIRLPHGRCL